MTSIEALNQALFLHINGQPGAPLWQVNMALGFAKYLILAIPLLLAGFWLWGSRFRRELALKATLVTGFTLLLNGLTSLVCYHPRPFAMPLGHTFISHVADSSFPSDHMTVFVSVGLTLFFARTRGLGALLLLSSIGVAWSRIFLGVHFPLDMLGATLYSSVSYAVVTAQWTRHGTALVDAAERAYRKLCPVPLRTGWLRG